jgi:hypothetical protein
MTDYSKMTDEQINEAIFKAKGWVELPPPAAPPWQRPSDGGVESWHSSFPPDYIHDWRLCGELLEEMYAGGGEPSLRSDDTFGWHCSAQIQKANSMGIGVFATTPLRAICEAWMEWSEEQ